MAKFKQIRSLSEILLSAEMESVLAQQGDKVLQAASTDPNPAYVETLDMHAFRSKSRVSIQVGAAPNIGTAVEAKRGTLAKALGAIGA